MLDTLNSTGRRLAAFAGAVAIAALSAPASAATVGCPPPNTSSFVEPTGVNNAGVIVGSCINSSSQTISFIDNAGTYTILSAPGADAYKTFGTGISNSGEVVGYYTNATGYHGFTDIGGTYATVDIVSGATLAYGVNTSGAVVGQTALGGSIIQGFVYSGGTTTYVSDPNGPLKTYAFGINDAGDVVGNYQDSASARHGFVATPTGNAAAPYTYVTLDDPEAQAGTTAAVGMNNLGQVVGYYENAAGYLEGFLYSNGVYYDQTGSAPNTQVFAVNDSGMIAGVSYTTPSSVGGFTAPADIPAPISVPEPRTWAILLLGLGVTLAVRWGLATPKLKAA